MRCGHTMHSKCFDEYTADSYQCPLCMRSLTSMEKYFEQLDEIVRNERMPPEYDNKRSTVLCNDCGEKGVVKYHFNYHKCAASCGSYNTKLLDVFDLETKTDEPETNSDHKAPEMEVAATSASSGAAQVREECHSLPATSTGLTMPRPVRSVYDQPYSPNDEHYSPGQQDSGDECQSPTDGSHFGRSTVRSTVHG